MPNILSTIFLYAVPVLVLFLIVPMYVRKQLEAGKENFKVLRRHKNRLMKRGRRFLQPHKKELAKRLYRLRRDYL